MFTNKYIEFIARIQRRFLDLQSKVEAGSLEAGVLSRYGSLYFIILRARFLAQKGLNTKINDFPYFMNQETWI